MLLSLTHGYLFIANQKVASESIHLIAGDDADLSFVQINNDKHVTFDELSKVLKNGGIEVDLSALMTFSIIREPAEWYVSWFNSRARKPLANPAHKRHHVYTGATDFDTFLKLAQQDPPDRMTTVKGQHHFFKRSDGGEVNAIPFPMVSDGFAKLLGSGSALSQFRLGDAKHHKNKSAIRRMSSSDLTTEQRRIINEELFARDWKLFQKAQRRFDKLTPATPQAEQAAALRHQLEQNPALASFAHEAAYGEAQARLYRGEDAKAVRQSLSRYQHIDLAQLMSDVSKRVDRFRKEKDL